MEEGAPYSASCIYIAIGIPTQNHIEHMDFNFPNRTSEGITISSLGVYIYSSQRSIHEPHLKCDKQMPFAQFNPAGAACYLLSGYAHAIPLAPILYLVIFFFYTGWICIFMFPPAIYVGKKEF